MALRRKTHKPGCMRARCLRGWVLHDIPEYHFTLGPECHHIPWWIPGTPKVSIKRSNQPEPHNGQPIKCGHLKICKIFALWNQERHARVVESSQNRSYPWPLNYREHRPHNNVQHVLTTLFRFCPKTSVSEMLASFSDIDRLHHSLKLMLRRLCFVIFQFLDVSYWFLLFCCFSNVFIACMCF